MKLKNLLIICAIAVLMFPLSLYAENWAAKINNETISMEDFNRFYYFQCKIMADVQTDEEVDNLAAKPEYANHPMFSKSGYLDHLIAQKLLFKKAMEDKTVNEKELSTLMELIKMQSVAQYYLGKKIKDKVAVTDEEVNKYYEENKENFAGRPKEEVTAYIKKQLVMQKSRMETNKYIQDLLSENKIDKNNLSQQETKTENKPSSDKQQGGKKLQP